MKKLLASSGAVSVLAFLAGCLLVLAAVWVFSSQLFSVTALRAQSIQLGDRLTELKSSVAMLKATTDAERFYGSESREAFEEQASVYILPDTVDAARTVHLFATLSKMVSVEGSPCVVMRLTFDPAVSRDSVTSVPAHLTLSCNAAQVARILAILGYSGKMIVADALGNNTADFLHLVEDKAPVSLPDAYTLLHTDLATYAADPDDTEGRLLSALSVQDGIDVKTFLLQSGLSDVRTVLSGPAATLKEEHAWPLPLLSVDRFSFDGQKAQVDLSLYQAK